MQSIKVNKAFRYVETGLSEAHQPLLVVLHGYGQLVAFFSKKFHVLESNYRLVFPEGTHRFYLNGTSGRVGASWMTKEWREQDIQENNAALETLLDHLVETHQPSSITVLGFSQGLATAMRWISETKHPIDHFVSWAGVIPPDLTLTSNWEHIAKKTAVLGTNDQFFNDEQAEEFIANYRDIGFECLTFEGNHDLHPETLKTIL